MRVQGKASPRLRERRRQISFALDALPYRPYLDEMVRKLRVLFRSFGRATLAVAVMLCLAMTPLCAARCAAMVCTPLAANHSTGECHHSSSHTGPAAAYLGAAPTALCIEGELLFTAPRLQRIPVSADPLDSTFAPGPLSLDMAAPPLLREPGGLGISPPSLSASNFSAPLVFRI